MYMIDNRDLNRIKIRDMMAAVKKQITPDSGLQLMLLELLNQREKRALLKTTDKDLEEIEKIYIRYTLGIDYYPSQNKKIVKINGHTTILPINVIYGSENN
jgi:hypothetical protein